MPRPRTLVAALSLSFVSACATTPPAVTRVAATQPPSALAPGPADAPPTPPEAAWEKIREEDGIVVHRREIPGSQVIAFRGEGVVQAPLLRVATVLVDVDRTPEWVDSVVEARELKRTGHLESISYSHVKTPPMIADRDFVLHGALKLEPGRRLVIQIRSVLDDAMPPGKYVRGEVMDSSFVLTDEGGTTTRVVAEIHADPKGSLPKWLVNVFQRGWAVKTLRSLREQVKKRDITDAPWLAELLSAGG